MSIPWKPSSGRKAGKEWEAECLRGFEYPNRIGDVAASRYGVMASPMPDPNHPGKSMWIVRPSYPDIEGALNGGRQFIFDCKAVTSGPSLPMSKLRDERKKQLDHMLNRSRVGVICFFCVYLCEWETKSDYQHAAAYAIPVWRDHPVWKRFIAGDVSNLNRFQFEEYGVPVTWHTPPRCKEPRPDILSVIHTVAEKLDEARGVRQASLF